MALRFDPEQHLADQIEVIEDAIIVPFGDGTSKNMARPAGVFYPDGRYCETAQTWRASNRPTIVEPRFPEPEEITGHLSGTVLFGGLGYGHFGHALCESTARLWGLDHSPESIDQVVFIPKRQFTWPSRSLPPLRPIINALGDIPDLVAVGSPTRVDRLVVPPQGFGVNDMIGACPEFRTFMDERLRKTVTAAGPEKIFISRSKLFRKRGRFLQEEELERHFEAEGFSIFHPQEHNVATQLAQYKAAKVIVSSDNSALHLAAFVVSSECRIAILLRRPGTIYKDFIEQFDRFAGISPVIIDACSRFWFREDEPVQFNEVISYIDLEKTSRELVEHGFIEGTAWPNLSEREMEIRLEDFEERADTLLEEVFP
nr:glycosyltransferase family 61 protein [uncultured Shimia sp.]